MIKYNLFDKLEENDATDVVYFVIKMLSKARNDTKIEDVPNDLSDKLINVAEQFLEYAKTEVSLEDEDKTEDLINSLYLYLEERSLPSTQEEINRGKELLKKIDLF